MGSSSSGEGETRRSKVGAGSYRLADAAREASLALGVVLLLSVLPLYWFSRNWYLYADNSWYLLSAQNILNGRGYTVFGHIPQPLRDPVLPGLLAILLILLQGSVQATVWAMRLLAVLNPLLIYAVIGRSGDGAAALLALFSYVSLVPQAYTVDALELTVYMLSVVALILAVDSRNPGMALLSGVLLGLAILTKETAFAGLPVALLAWLLLDWSFRGAVSHYVGLALVCAPWWLWVWLQTGSIYLLESGQDRAVQGSARHTGPVTRALLIYTFFMNDLFTHTTGCYNPGDPTRWRFTKRKETCGSRNFASGCIGMS